MHNHSHHHSHWHTPALFMVMMSMWNHHLHTASLKLLLLLLFAIIVWKVRFKIRFEYDVHLCSDWLDFFFYWFLRVFLLLSKNKNRISFCFIRFSLKSFQNIEYINTLSCTLQCVYTYIIEIWLWSRLCSVRRKISKNFCRFA